MGDDMVNICDENNNLTGEKCLTREAHEKGLWHRASYVWIYNSQGEILIQLRAKDKKLFPGMWDISAAGHVRFCEEPLVCALRETKGEVGLKVGEKELEFWKITKNRIDFKGVKNYEFYYVYFLRFDGKISDLKLQKEEVILDLFL